MIGLYFICRHLRMRRLLRGPQYLRWIEPLVWDRSERYILFRSPGVLTVNFSPPNSYAITFCLQGRHVASTAAFSSSSRTTDSSEEQSNMTATRVQQRELRRQYMRKQQQPQHQRGTHRISQQQPTSARVENLHDEVLSQRSSVASGSAEIPLQETETPTPAQVKEIMDLLHHDLTILLRQIMNASMDTNDIVQTPLPGNIPFWALESHHLHESESILFEHQNVFVRTIELQNQLKKYVERKWIRPGTIHRHEFVALVGDLLQIYSCLTCNVFTEKGESNSALLAYTLELIDWIRSPPYGLELSHKQCHAVITVAAKCSQWTTAAQVYVDHIDPDVAGFIPVPVTTASARAFTVAGLYCVARAALKTATLPVENVFDAVTKLTMVSPSDTESCKYTILQHFH
jgi:hypothetical protein